MKHADKVILVAEDQEIVAMGLLLELKFLGYSAHAVNSGEDVIRELEENIYDLVVMDVHLNGLDGITTTRIIRSKENKTGLHIPIIGFTSDEELSSECIRAGMDDCVSKCIRADALRKLIEKFLDS